MRGLKPLRGTWFAVLVALIPLVLATVAAAEPWTPPAPDGAGPDVSALATTLADAEEPIEAHHVPGEDPATIPSPDDIAPIFLRLAHRAGLEPTGAQLNARGRF